MPNCAVNSSHEPLLEICYPTFNRVEACILNVREVLKCEDSRFKIHISSNCPAPELVHAFSGNSKVKIHEFQTNQGFALNVKYLLVTSDARYKLLMSDEDTIESSNLIKLLDFLGSSNSRNSVYYSPSYENYSLGTILQLSNKTLNYREVMLTHPMNPTYLSGYIFQPTTYRNLNIDPFFEDWPVNAYPFIKLRNEILRNGGKFMILSGMNFKQGVAIHHGGTNNDELYSKSSRVIQFQNFLFKDAKGSVRELFFRLASALLIANQVQNGMNCKVYLCKEKGTQTSIWDFGIQFIDEGQFKYKPVVIFSQILLKSFQKLTGLYRLYLRISKFDNTHGFTVRSQGD